MYSVDLNCDMGEGCANDTALMDFVSSVNIACGYHAGDTETMNRTVENALEKGLAIGAHPGYADRDNFGRRPKSLSANEIKELIGDQISLLANICRIAGAKLRHVKPHGALYNQAARDAGLAAAIAAAVRDFDPALILFGLSGSISLAAAEQAGLCTASEVFADRTYGPDGNLTPRTEPNALIMDAGVAAEQAIAMASHGMVVAIDGTPIALKADTICIHGDGVHALEFAEAIYTKLNGAGISVRPVAQT